MTDQNVINLVEKLRITTQKMPNIWDGKSAILEMKDWRFHSMETN